MNSIPIGSTWPALLAAQLKAVQKYVVEKTLFRSSAQYELQRRLGEIFDDATLDGQHQHQMKMLRSQRGVIMRRGRAKFNVWSSLVLTSIKERLGKYFRDWQKDSARRRRVTRERRRQRQHQQNCEREQRN
jgi:hypothetical protein